MQKFIFSLVIAVFMSSGLSYADVVIITNQDGAIYTASEKDDTAVPDGYKKTIVKGTLSEIMPSARPIDEYSFDGKKFNVNAKEVKAKEDAQLARDKKDSDKKLNKDSAINKLKALGLSDNEISALIGEE